MFKSRSTQQHEQAMALVGMVGSIASATAGMKGRGAERMEAMAQVVAALGFDSASIKSVEISWQIFDGEYCPTLKMESTGNNIKEIVQIERTAETSHA